MPGENSATLEADSSGTYILTVTDENGCRSSDAVTIIFDQKTTDSFIEVPDVFMIGHGGLIATYRNASVYDIKIFDERGRLISYGNTFPLVWDGTVRGSEAAPAMYYYMINYTNLTGEKGLKKGEVRLVK